MRWLIGLPPNGATEVEVVADTAEEAARAFVAMHVDVMTWLRTEPCDPKGSGTWRGFSKMTHEIVSFAPVAIVLRRAPADESEGGDS